MIQAMITRQPLLRLRVCPQLSRTGRAFSAATGLRSDGSPSSSAASAAPNSRWLSDIKSRVALGITQKAQEPKALAQLKHHMSYLDQHWLNLSAGREGYLIEPQWRGLDKHNIAWGDMVCLKDVEIDFEAVLLTAEPSQPGLNGK